MFVLSQHINELSMKLDVEEILQKAEGIYLQIRSCKVKHTWTLCLWGRGLMCQTSCH